MLFKVFFIPKHIKKIFFLFFKNYFCYQHIKIIWKYQKYINLKQKKSKFFKITFQPQCQTLLQNNFPTALLLTFHPLVVLLGFQVSPLMTREMHGFTVIMECFIHCLLLSLRNDLRFESSELLLFSIDLHNIPNSL